MHVIHFMIDLKAVESSSTLHMSWKSQLGYDSIMEKLSTEINEMQVESHFPQRMR